MRQIVFARQSPEYHIPEHKDIRMTDRVGQQLGNYRLLNLIGRGNFAEVYLGEHLHLDTQAAIKVMQTSFTREDEERFYTEARTVARLAHPHIVRILDFDVKDGFPYLVMEYAPNGTLRQRHPKGTRVPLDIVVSYVKQVANALQYIHTQKLIHRDVKPESMVLGRNNELLLSDFSTAIIAQSTRSAQTRQPQEVTTSVAYMAPEQLMGKPRPSSDQYALAVVTYEWLSGEPPFSGSVQQMANQHLSTPPPSLSGKVPSISSTVEHVVFKALAKDPQQRFANVQDFALALEEAYKAEAAGRTPFASSADHPTESEQGKLASRNLPTGTVTLLFTDIEGSTHLLQQLGDRYAGVLSECRNLLRVTFQEWNGREVDTQGDAFFISFARATDSVSAAVEAQRALASHSWPEGVAVRVRMGIHTGEPTLTSEGYVGLDVHRAARIMSAGHGGQVLLSQTTSHLVEQDLPDDVMLRDLGEYRLKDLGRPKRLFQLVIADLPADFPPLKTLDIYPNNLPVQFTPFIGREQELGNIQQLLLRDDVRLLTLTGPGGAGKTRLGLQVTAELSDRFLDGVFFVNLAPINDPILVVPAIAETLGIQERADPFLLERLKEVLHQKRMLLLLDNFEQVVPAGVQVVDVLAACPGLKMLVTSREVLHVQAEHEFPVPPLALPDPKRLPDLAVLSHNAAVALFLQRAQAVKPDFQLTNANARAIVEICVRLDGLPLAIELAAARMKLLPPQALLARLDQRLAVLTGTSRDLPARQQTLRNTIAWSYNLLDAAEQRLFRRLSIFVGGCTLQAIEAVCASLDNGDEAGQALDGIASLVDKSLLQQTEQEGEEPRFVMLETIRDYGLERLAVNGEMETTQQAHAAYHLALAEEAEPQLLSNQQVKWLERLDREHENLRAALQRLLEYEEAEQNKEMALRLGAALEEFWVIRGYHSEGRPFLERALAASEGVATLVRAKALSAAGRLALNQGDFDHAEVLCEQHLALCRELGDTAGIALSLQRLAIVAWVRHNATAAYALTDEAQTLWREVDDKAHVAWALSWLAYMSSQQGEYARGLALCEESLTIFRQLENKIGTADVLCRLAETRYLSQSNSELIFPLLEEALALYREVGDKMGIAACLRLSGLLALSQGNAAEARSLAEEALALFRETGHQKGISISLHLLARVEATQGNYQVARTLYEQSLATASRGTDDVGLIASCLEGLAAVVAAQGELTWAARLWGAAEVHREVNGAPLPPVDRPVYEGSVSAARSNLGDETFAVAWVEGRTLTPEQALTAQGRVTLPQPLPTTSSSAPPAKPSPTYPDGLTAREVEVLRLLAQGMTDAQIAEQLVISPRTVNNHLTSIYQKIQVSSRSAATRYAVDHNLA
jgi:predicted ATPase/serine/threonine protein kinase/DNA-binding CsgD family transcriptional regulator